MDFTQIYNELENAPLMMLEHDRLVGSPWRVQNDLSDNQTRFIFEATDVNELINNPNYINLQEERIKQYAFHRWFNRKTSETAEMIFAEYGARAATMHQNRSEKFDIFINGTRFDVKITNYPLISQRFTRNMNLALRENRDTLLKELYRGQSTGQRANGAHHNNRLDIICDINRDIPNNENIFSNDSILLEQYKLRMDFDQLEVKIKTYLNYLRENNYCFNEITTYEDNRVLADVIRLTPEGYGLKQQLSEGRCPDCGGNLKISVANNALFKGNMLLVCRSGCGYYKNI